MFAQLLLGAVAAAGVADAQVTAIGPMGDTNPAQATLGTSVNQTSMARLISLNAIDDFCVFAPPEPNSAIGDTETEEVAWCVQPRNNARVIPDGTFTAVHFVKTPLYWQIQGFGDLTKINIAAGDFGGELDPHGATGKGNPIGGNVTTNATGQDVHYEEWMNYISSELFCLRICIADNATYSASAMCQHTLDVMGCSWVMPGDYTRDSFTECDADAAYPPGVYPVSGGGFSTFAQRWTGTYGGAVHTIGDTSTPAAPFSTPASSNCKTYTSIGNGIPTAALSSNAVFSFTSGMSYTVPSNTPVSSSGGSGAVATDSAGQTTGSSDGQTDGSGSAATPSSSTGGSSKDKSGANPAAIPMIGAASIVAIFAGAATLFF